MCESISLLNVVSSKNVKLSKDTLKAKCAREIGQTRCHLYFIYKKKNRLHIEWHSNDFRSSKLWSVWLLLPCSVFSPLFICKCLLFFCSFVVFFVFLSFVLWCAVRTAYLFCLDLLINAALLLMMRWKVHSNYGLVDIFSEEKKKLSFFSVPSTRIFVELKQRELVVASPQQMRFFAIFPSCFIFLFRIAYVRIVQGHQMHVFGQAERYGCCKRWAESIRTKNNALKLWKIDWKCTKMAHKSRLALPLLINCAHKFLLFPSLGRQIAIYINSINPHIDSKWDRVE